MKIVQSFWGGSQKNILNNYGWYAYKYHWMSWILSSHQLLKFYEKVELYTDDFGFDILINKLKLPYTKVHLVLNDLDGYPKDLWALAKIKTYSLQEEPFIHIDGDVFIWSKFPDHLVKSELIAQNLENTTEYYREMWNNFSTHLKFLPEELLSFHNGTTNLSCNMGIVGGTDINFFKRYATKSLEFVDKNKLVWEKINLFNFNIFFEQELFYELALEESKNIEYMFDEIWGDDAYEGFGDFHEIPFKRTYLHLLGVFKRHAAVCKSMEVYVMKYLPEQYTLLSKMINSVDENAKEIEDLSLEKIDQFLIEFQKELEHNTFSDENLLLKRDLYNEGLQHKMEQLIKNGTDFKMTILSNSFTRKKNQDNTYSEFVAIEELNVQPRIYFLDEVDLIMLDELSHHSHYSLFISSMNDYFDTSAGDAIEEFLTLINNRLQKYLVLKIISIHI